MCWGDYEIDLMEQEERNQPPTFVSYKKSKKQAIKDKKKIENLNKMEENKRPRLLRKFYSKLFMVIATLCLAIYSLINVNEGPIWFMCMMTNGVLCVYFLEGVNRVKKRLNGKWL